MEKRRVFVLDDKPGILNAFQNELLDRGFEVITAATSRQADERIRELEGEVDVAILDMRLDEAEDGQYVVGVTGADVAARAFRRHQGGDSAPEYLIYSAFTDSTEYYRRAVKLGVAEYLDKTKVKVVEVISHVRALAIRRSLDNMGAAMLDRIERIAQNATDRIEAVEYFCADVLDSEMTALLGAPFSFFVSEVEAGEIQRTVARGGELGLPSEPLEAFDELQRVVFLPSPFQPERIFSGSNLQQIGIAREFPVLRQASFVPLARTRDFALSLAIVQVDPNVNPRAENAATMAKLIGRYFREPVIHHLLDVMQRWTLAEERRKRFSAQAGELFLNLGREQLRLLDEAKRAGEITQAGEHVGRLRALGEDLRDAGEALGLGTADGEIADQDLRPLIETVWDKGRREPATDSTRGLEVIGQAKAQGDGERLYGALARLLRWFGERAEGGAANQVVVQVELEPGPRRTRIVLQDDSPRLTPELRRRLFEPFSLGSGFSPPAGWRKGRRFGLFLAKMLIESQPGGSLEDRTAEMAGERGHRFVVELPPASMYREALG